MSWGGFNDSILFKYHFLVLLTLSLCVSVTFSQVVDETEECGEAHGDEALMVELEHLRQKLSILELEMEELHNAVQRLEQKQGGRKLPLGEAEEERPSWVNGDGTGCVLVLSDSKGLGVEFMNGWGGFLHLCVRGQEANVVGFIKRTDNRTLLSSPMFMPHREVSSVATVFGEMGRPYSQSRVTLSHPSVDFDLAHIAPWLRPSVEQTYHMKDAFADILVVAKRTDSNIHLIFTLVNMCHYLGDHLHIDISWVFGIDDQLGKREVLPFDGSQVVGVRGSHMSFKHNNKRVTQDIALARLYSPDDCNNFHKHYNKMHLKEMKRVGEELEDLGCKGEDCIVNVDLVAKSPAPPPPPDPKKFYADVVESSQERRNRYERSL